MEDSGILSVLPIQGMHKSQNIGVLTVIPSARKLLPLEMVISLACQSAPTHMTTGYLGIKNLPIETARELSCEKALELGVKYLWFIDDDTVPPANSLKRLIYVLDNYPDVGAIGGVYVTRDPVQPQPVVFRGMGNGSYWGWKAGDVFEVTGMGMGCALIRVEALNKMPKPWFKFEEAFGVEGGPIRQTMVSEDIFFCNKMQDAGYKIFAHGGILCDHWDVETGDVYRLPENSYPLRPREVAPSPVAEKPQESQKVIKDE